MPIAIATSLSGSAATAALRSAGLKLADVTLNPNASSLPGSNTLQSLVNGVAGWALVLCLAGLVIGAAAWALGSHSQNYHQSMVGRRAVLVSGLAALIIGAAPTLINFFFHTGQAAH
jgi:MFS family permease